MGEQASVHGFEYDLMQPRNSERLVEELRDQALNVNHLVNNARSLSFLAMNEFGVAARKDFMAEYLMDVIAPYELSTALWRSQPTALRTITNISSQYGVVAATPALYDDHARQSPIQYGVAKAALNHLTKELAVRLADDDVRVNAIAYGGVDGRTDEAFKARYSKLAPAGKMLAEEELPGPLEFLVSEQSSAMTGQIIQADGGWTIW
ncbi:short-chain dehydrogenase/reductase [Salinisphaera dokdonensis CL-ES53]|uniref:Short-chain dehydrogenase/reductase n=2 Tax=Salinisphaera TaxID=180541 RepID=A0ABV2AVU0_9GAMM